MKRNADVIQIFDKRLLIVRTCNLFIVADVGEFFVFDITGIHLLEPRLDVKPGDGPCCTCQFSLTPEEGAKEGAPFIETCIIQTTEKAFDDFAASGVDKELNRRTLGLEG